MTAGSSIVMIAPREGKAGFYIDVPPGVIGLTPGQHLLVLAAIVTFDGSFRH